MKIKNKKGVEFDITPEAFRIQIADKGNAHKYCIIDDDAPVEVKQLRDKKKK